MVAGGSKGREKLLSRLKKEGAPPEMTAQAVLFGGETRTARTRNIPDGAHKTNFKRTAAALGDEAEEVERWPVTLEGLEPP